MTPRKEGFPMQTQSRTFNGLFQYAGGHPDCSSAPTPGKKEVLVDDQGLSFRRKGFHVLGSEGEKALFTIPAGDIAEVRHSQQSGGLFSPPDQLIEVDMRRGDSTYTVRFKAMGYSKQNDAFALYGAVDAVQGKTHGD
jgi:hypothetical protein